MSRERVWEFVLLSSGLIFRVSDDVSAAWSLSFRCASSHAEKGLVMVVRCKASQRHGARPTVFSVLPRTLKKGLSWWCGAKRRSGMVPVLRFSACKVTAFPLHAQYQYVMIFWFCWQRSTNFFERQHRQRGQRSDSELYVVCWQQQKQLLPA